MPTRDIKSVYGTVRELPANVDETRTIPFIASTKSKDRHGTILNQDNWDLEAFNKNGIIGYQHDVYGGGICLKADPDDVIGSGRAYVRDGQLMVDVTFETEDVNPKAEKIFKKVKAGTLKAVSVGFLPKGEGKYGTGEEARGAKNETYYFAGQELLELSIVNIPSNPDAVRKSLGDQTANALMFIKRNMGREVSFADIEKMTVREVLDTIEGKEEPEKPEEETQVEKPVLLALPDAHEHFLTMNNHK